MLQNAFADELVLSQVDKMMATNPTVRYLPRGSLQTGTNADNTIRYTEGKKELFAAWGIFISLALLIAAFFVSYMLQMKKVTAVHETVISIFAGLYFTAVRNFSNAFLIHAMKQA